MDVTARLAKFIADLKYESIPPKAVETAKVAVRDCLGVALAGSREEDAKICAEIARQELDEAVATVKRVMEAAHGGRWNISINHESCFVLVAREFDPTEMEIIKNRWPSVDG